MILKLSGGQYSDYWEHWYTGETVTHAELGQRLLAHADQAEQIRNERDKARWDECEALFGIHEWPYCSGMKSPKGTEEQFLAWRDKWDGALDYETVVMELCGFTRVRPGLEVDLGWWFPSNPEELKGFVTELMEGDTKR